MRMLVVVDMQNDFVTGVLGSEAAQTIVPHVVRRVEEAVRAGDTVVFTQDTHGADYLDTQEGKKLPVPHCLKGSRGWEIIPQLQGLAKGCKLVEKPAFGSQDLAHLAASECYNQIELIGVCTDICVISNAMLLKAALPEAEISVDAAGCAGVSQQAHENALAAMQACQICVRH